LVVVAENLSNDLGGATIVSFRAALAAAKRLDALRLKGTKELEIALLGIAELGRGVRATLSLFVKEAGKIKAPHFIRPLAANTYRPFTTEP
jgi:hypothetical protein